MANKYKYFNRDLSWLRFNHRVLQEATDNRNPLYDRLKFLAIFSSNLDEFFKVRVSNIRRVKSLKKDLRKKLITKPNKLLKLIKKEVHDQQEEFGNIFRKEIIPALKKEGVNLIDYSDFDSGQTSFAMSYYVEHLKDQVVIETSNDNQSGKLFVQNEQLYFAALVKEKLIIAKLPNETPRFVKLPNKEDEHIITYSDDILKSFLNKEFNSVFYSFKVSRDAELYLDDEFSGSLLAKIKNSLSRRDTGQVTRTLIDNKMPQELIDRLISSLDISTTDIVLGAQYHNFKDFFGFPNPTQKQLSYSELPPKESKISNQYESIFTALTDKDLLLYFPYESFQTVIDLAQQAASDPNVKVIKVTLYRVSKNSAIANALLLAVKNGKDVTVFIETKARFDEANNISWGQRLEKSGARIIYSYPAIKVHSKIMYIEQTIKGKTRKFGYIGTGNFNEKTSKIYTDFGLMTSNRKITSDLLRVFRVLEGELIVPKTKKLLVAPFNARSTFRAEIENEISNAKSGKEAYIILKLNSLEDKKMINLLYKASNAGVDIKLIVRGICCLVPGIKGQSENIVITSIVDRFLEHARVYMFGNKGKEKMYIGSADWMTRNLDNRIEVITPILDKDVFEKIKMAIDLQLNDKVKSRIIDKNQKNEYISKSSEGQSSQHLVYEQIL